MNKAKFDMAVYHISCISGTSMCTLLPITPHSNSRISATLFIWLQAKQRDAFLNTKRFSILKFIIENTENLASKSLMAFQL